MTDKLRDNVFVSNLLGGVFILVGVVLIVGSTVARWPGGFA